MILVVGMHRSGTSAITGALGALGLALPPPGDLMIGHPGNPAHYESISLSAFNESLLRARGGSWSAPPLTLDRSDVVAGLADSMSRARRTASTVFDLERPCVWKDPRLCLLLPFWRSTLKEVRGALFVWRRPDEVARSLVIRARYSVSHALSLWDWYNRQALLGLEGLPVFATSYEDALGDPAGFVDRFTGWASQCAGVDLDRSGVDLPLDPALRHNRDEAHAMLLDEQVELIRVLTAVEGAHPQFAPPALPPISNWARDLLVARRDFEGIEATAAKTGTELTRLGQAYNRLAESISAMQTVPGQRIAVPPVAEAQTRDRGGIEGTV